MKPDTILVLDFGGQYAHLISRRIRENGVYSEVVSFGISYDDISNLSEKFNVKGLILSGGPSSVYDQGSPKISRSILESKLPMLGLCYGHQLLSYVFGGNIKKASKKEFGHTLAQITKPIAILNKLNRTEKVWMSHGDTVYSMPSEFETLATTDNCPVAAFRHKVKPIFGIQWHPEVAHTVNGNLILKNFIFDICKCENNWQPTNFIKSAINEIKQTVGNEKAIIGLSGGIDSSTTALLASKALGKNLVAVFVDHGFMREGETEEIKKIFKNSGINLIIADAKKQFLTKLKGVKDPEEKRKVIGNEFIKVFEKIAEKVKATYLLQGTIYPDRIESGSTANADKIKTHHNVGGLPSKMKFKKIVEPLRDLYKDEVRNVAEELSMPINMARRQPFPGPALAVRIIGEVTEEKLIIVKKADKIVREEIEKSNLTGNLWQYFAILTDTKTTGVKGDSRAYGYTVAIRAVESKEAMTANFAKLPYEVLEKISTRITNEIPEVSRVVYDVTHKPPSTIEWE
ncbi:MAG: glutamine-hydrolyzing GMP synthase [Candidatus Aenigmarchaeota archaeon]|nr:glutamine-hydrolyzing GMP synthase [Candidatus Aenigmarchaeota archaeon]